MYRILKLNECKFTAENRCLLWMELNIKQISWRVSLHWKRGSEYCVLLSATKVLINSGDTKGLGTIAISLFVVPHGARRQYISLAKGLGMKFFINQKIFFLNYQVWKFSVPPRWKIWLSLLEWNSWLIYPSLKLGLKLLGALFISYHGVIWSI